MSLSPFERWPSETRTEAVLGATGWLFCMAVIYVGIPAFVIAAFLRLVVFIYQAMPW